MGITRRPILSRRALLMAKIETTSNVDSVPTPSANAILCSDPNFNVDPNELERNTVKSHLSPDGSSMGRLLSSVTFNVELRGDGDQNTGALPRIDPLLRACGMSSNVATSLATRTYGPYKGKSNTGPVVTWAKSGSIRNTLMGIYKLTVISGGASTVATVQVTGGIPGVDTYIGQNTQLAAFVTRNDATAATTTITLTSSVNTINNGATVGGTPQTGDKINMVILGRDVDYTLVAADDTVAKVATKLVAAINTALDGLVVATDDTGGHFTFNISGTFTHTVPTGTEGTEYVLGADYTATILGQDFTYEIQDNDTQDEIATGIAAAVDAVAEFSASATGAVVTVTCVAGSGSRTVTLTSGSTGVGLGNSGVIVTPTWTGNLVAGDVYHVLVFPSGVVYHPVSDYWETCTIYLYLDGVMHKLTGCQGTFTMSSEAGGFGQLSFTMTGSFYDPVDAAMPTDADYVMLAPPKIENAYYAWDYNHNLRANSITFDMGNSVVPRADVNKDDGYDGTRITERNPVGTVDPEMVLIREKDFWNQYQLSLYMTFQARFGTVAGNTVWIVSPSVQMSAPNYGDRDQIRVLQNSLKFCGTNGDDEIFFCFC